MLTREQIVEQEQMADRALMLAVAHGPDHGLMYVNANVLKGLCRLALLALDGEADRKLGAAVGDCLDPVVCAALMEGDHTPAYESNAVDALLEAIASALREEGAK